MEKFTNHKKLQIIRHLISNSMFIYNPANLQIFEVRVCQHGPLWHVERLPFYNLVRRVHEA